MTNLVPINSSFNNSRGHRRPINPDIRLRQLAARLHGLGVRALFEFLAETRRNPSADLMQRLEAYAALTPAKLAATGGDRLPYAVACFTTADEIMRASLMPRSAAR